MRPAQARFITACQQLLAVGVVIAVLAPAASVVSLDVRINQPEPSAAEPNDSGRQGLVETEAVEAEVTEVEMTPATTAAGRRVPGAEAGAARSSGELLSRVEPVEGYGAVGVTWSPRSDLDEEDITLEVRTRTDAEWTGWKPLEYHAEHGPDPGSEEARGARPGTDALLVGEVDDVQARAVTSRGVARPQGMKLAVIAPGTSQQRRTEEPEIDTAALDGPDDGPDDDGPDTDGPDGDDPDGPDTDGPDGELATSAGDVELRAGTHTRRPRIFSRAQWGANERLRDKSSLSYYEVHAGFVHHTVNGNSYTRAQVPGIIRSIYAYHTRSRGWSDIGYNFLVDKFGRIWEGRAGGVARPVVGAHTQGYNSYSFAMSAIGNFETARPRARMLNAYGRLFAWKLSLHGVDAASRRQRVGSGTFRAISGHRDAGATACPGRHLYARLPAIRRKAARHQADWSGRDRHTNLVGTRDPDIVLRSDKGGFILPTEGMLKWRKPRTFGGFGPRYDAVAVTPDVTGDGKADVLARFRNGLGGIRPGLGNGKFAAMIGKTRQFARLQLITAVGDLDEDGRNDLVARDRATGRLQFLRGRGNGTFRKLRRGPGWRQYDKIVAGGDLDGDGHRDILGRTRAGVLWLHAGTGNGTFERRTRMRRNWKRYDVILGNADFTDDGHDDLYVRIAKNQLGLIFPGNGNGRLGHWLGRFGRTQGATHMAATQVVGSKDPDLLGVRNRRLITVPHNGTQNTGALRGRGTWRFGAADTLLNVGDWDGDGRNDVVQRNRHNGNLVIHRGRPGGRFARPKFLSKGWGRVRLLAAVGDTTGDGHPDLMGQPAGRSMRIYPGNGNRFHRSYVAHSPVSASGHYGIGRWDGDGAPDNLFRVGNSLRWYAGNGPGGPTGPLRRLKGNLAPFDWVISPGDVNRDGREDLVVRGRRGGILWLLPGTARGFGKPRFLAAGFGKFDLAG